MKRLLDDIRFERIPPAGPHDVSMIGRLSFGATTPIPKRDVAGDDPETEVKKIIRRALARRLFGPILDEVDVLDNIAQDLTLGINSRQETHERLIALSAKLRELMR